MQDAVQVLKAAKRAEGAGPGAAELSTGGGGAAIGGMLSKLCSPLVAQSGSCASSLAASALSRSAAAEPRDPAGAKLLD